MGRVVDGLMHAWNVFNQNSASETRGRPPGYSSIYGNRPLHNRVMTGQDRNLINTIYTKLTVDVASVELKHVRTNRDGQYVEDIQSGLNECLTVRPNLDQGPRKFLQDYAETLFRTGAAVVAPIDYDDDPDNPGSIEIRQLRVGTVVDWMPRDVRISVYDDRPEFGEQRELVVAKERVAIVENPFYDIMNAPNSTLQRLLRKLALLDRMDEDAASNKLDLIVQLPYQVKSETKRMQAEQRRRDIELQLKGSQYGIAYTDGTERITQLNRSVENTLMTQIPYLWEKLYDQLGLTPEVINGTADNATMANYQSRVIEPVLDSLAEEMVSKFITKRSRSRGQTITYFRNPFKLIPLPQLAEVADVFSRNEIVSPNELRQSIGMRPSSNPQADELRNSNMPNDDAVVEPVVEQDVEVEAVEEGGNTEIMDSLDGVDKELDAMFKEFGVEDEEE